MTDKTKKDTQTEVDLFFKGLSINTSKVTLPSQGLIYKVTKGELSVNPMTWKEERLIAANSRQDPAKIMDLLLESCVPGLDIDELLLIDKIFLILKIREASFGSKYKITARCSACTEVANLDLEIADLPIDYVPDDFTAVATAKLPMVKGTAKVRRVTVGDKIGDTTEELLTNLWKLVEELSTEEVTITSKITIKKIIEDLPITDINAILKEVTCADYGIQTKVKFTCLKCKAVNDVDLPFDSDFFTVS